MIGQNDFKKLENSTKSWKGSVLRFSKWLSCHFILTGKWNATRQEIDLESHSFQLSRAVTSPNEPKNNRGYGAKWHMTILRVKSFQPSWGFHTQLFLGHPGVKGEGEGSRGWGWWTTATPCVGVQVNKAIGVAHVPCSVLDDTDVGSSKADIRLQHFHYHLRWSGTIDAF